MVAVSFADVEGPVLLHPGKRYITREGTVLEIDEICGQKVKFRMIEPRRGILLESSKGRLRSHILVEKTW